MGNSDLRVGASESWTLLDPHRIPMLLYSYQAPYLPLPLGESQKPPSQAPAVAKVWQTVTPPGATWPQAPNHAATPLSPPTGLTPS
jgi:hypothetical protein